MTAENTEREAKGRATEELVRQYTAPRRTRIKGIDTKEIYHLVSRGVAWMGKAALLCLGLLAMLALVVVMTVLTAVMLIATVLPATTVRQKHHPRSRQNSENTSEFPAPREAAAS